MLIEAAHTLGLEPWVLCENQNSPVALLTQNIIIGRASDPSALAEFFKHVDFVAFENEFVDCAVLAAASAGLGIRFAPSLAAITLLQDKLSQKTLLSKTAIATADFDVPEVGTDPTTWTAALLKRWPDGVVLKWSRLGYDGKGVLVLKEVTPRNSGTIKNFFSEAAKRGGTIYPEKRIAFKRELAMAAVRSADGNFVHYPLVISEQSHGICSRVFGPATQLGVAPALEVQAAQACRKLGDETGIIGTFAVEFFETESGELLVNEIAPRVHNSAHFTQDAADTSQFENHWRAVLGMPLGSTHTAPAFSMVNLLGPDDLSLDDPDLHALFPAILPPAPEGFRLHWYGKTEVRPGRKLGHLNSSAATEDFAELRRRADDYLAQWQDALRAHKKSK